MPEVSKLSVTPAYLSDEESAVTAATIVCTERTTFHLNKNAAQVIIDSLPEPNSSGGGYVVSIPVEDRLKITLSREALDTFRSDLRQIFS